MAAMNSQDKPKAGCPGMQNSHGGVWQPCPKGRLRSLVGTQLGSGQTAVVLLLPHIPIGQWSPAGNVLCLFVSIFL